MEADGELDNQSGLSHEQSASGPEKLFDVVAQNIKTGEQRFIARGKSEENADAIVMMAVMRRGVDEEFFAAIPAKREQVV